MPEVFTEEWSRACCERLNASAAYRAAAATWEGTIVLVMTPDAAHGVPDERAVFIDAHRGECRGARVATPEDRDRAAFVFSADVPSWKQLLAGEIEPVTAVMKGRLRLVKGGLMQVAKHAAAAREMITAAAEVGGTFPQG